jgi:hypothetical protein
MAGPVAGVATIWKLVIGLAGLPGVQLTLADPFPRTAVPMVGALGAPGATGVAAFDGVESAPAATTFTARTTNWYVVPLVSPVITVLVGVTGRPVTVLAMVAPA